MRLHLAHKNTLYLLKGSGRLIRKIVVANMPLPACYC